MLKELKNFFYFHKRERTGVFILISIILLLIVLNYFLIPQLVKPEFNSAKLFQSDSLYQLLEKQLFDSTKNKEQYFYSEANTSDDDKSYHYSATNYALPTVRDKPKLKPFYFNPNTVTEQELVEMGFNNRFIKSFINYRNKGKIFKNPDDFKNVYGLTPQEFNQCVSFLNFPEPDNEKELKKENEIKKRKEQMLIDLNTADTSMLTKLSGIGYSFAKRIVLYRNRLGGFYKKEQLLEVWGIDSNLYKHIEPFILVGPAIRTIDINKVSLEQLKNHPYLSFSAANSIIQIRNRIGKFTKIEDIKQSVLIKPEVYEKIKPYLTISE
jgi:competence ComEA-like helix-hairpin-helix protein